VGYSTPINFTAVENALVAWVRNSTGLNVMWAKQDRPQVAKPFAVLKWIAGPTVVGLKDEQRRRMSGADLFTDIVGHRAMACNVQFFCASDAPGSNAKHYASIALASLNIDAVRDSFAAAKLSVSNVGSVADLDSIADGRFESRASFDLNLFTVSALIPTPDTPTNTIGTVDLDGPGE
jgi:hypothetical protein